jgi:hypothetical protein
MKLSRLASLATLAGLVALAAVAVTPVYADSITGRVTVTILDESGTPFPGVVVTLSSTKNIAPPVSVQTNPQGKATFGVVQAGSGYRITVEVAGYAKIQEDGINVATNPPVNLLFKLLPERVEKVTVVGERSKADLDEAQSTKFSGDFLEDLPIIGNSYQDALTLAPGVQDEDGDGNPNVHGARERDFKATVDGVSNVDPLTGTFMSNINPDASEEIEVVTEGADASYGGAVGGFAKVITKQGSNDFEGLFKFAYRSDLLDGNGAQPQPAEEFKFDYYRPGISINGPIVKDRLFYAVNHDYDDIGEPVALGSGQSLVIKTTGWRHLDKLTWQVSPRNKLNFQYSADPRDVGPLSNFGGFSSLANLDSGFNYNQGGPTYSVTWQTPINPNLNVTTLVGYSDTSIGFHPTTMNAQNDCVLDPTGQNGQRPGGSIDHDYCINQDTARISGSYFRDYQDKRQRFTLKSDATYFAQDFIGKEHTFDFGVVAEDVHFEDDSTYFPVSLYQTLPAALDQDGSTITFALAAQLFRTTYSPGAPDKVGRQADGRRYGAYIQDTFRPHPRVSIKAGVRLDYEAIVAPGFVPFDATGEFKQFNKIYNQCFSPGLEDTCTSIALGNFTGFEALPATSPLKPYVDSGAVLIRQKGGMGLRNLNLGPRLNVSWDPQGDGKTKIFGTYGRGYGETFLGLPTSEQGPVQFDEIFDVTLDLVNDPTQPGGFRTVPSVAATPNDTSSPTIRVIDRGLRTPYVNEYSFGITREILSETSLNLTYIHRDFNDQFQDIDANHFAEDKGDNEVPCVRVAGTGIFVPQGKPDGLFDDCAGASIIVGAEGGFGGKPIRGEGPDGIPDLKLRNPYFNQVFLVGNFNQEQYRAYKLELVRRMHHNWEMEASYVWSKALGQAEDFAQEAGNDPTTIQDEKGYVGYDQRHVIKINARTIVPVIGVTLGTIIGWESGQPYSINEVAASVDRRVAFGSLEQGYTQIRTTYPSFRRNDHRNDSYFDVNLSAQKEFRIKDVNVTGIFEIANLLNDDSRFIGGVRNGQVDSIRRFGRYYEFTAKVNF